MSEYEYGRVTQEIIDRLNEIAPRRVYTGDEINDDFTHDEMSIYGKAEPGWWEELSASMEESYCPSQR